jgi:hypothetical protein
MDSRFRWPDKIDAALSALLVVQVLTLFVAIPLSAKHPAAHVLLDACHLVFAMICVAVLTRHRLIQAALLGALALLAIAPSVGSWLLAHRGFDSTTLDETIALTAFVFNAAVTSIVAIHVFGPGRVTGHRIRGAILLYLNVAALFSIAYSALEAHLPGSIMSTTGTPLATVSGLRAATLSYFSLSTITTTGFGDFVPVDPFARSLASLESVVGQLFPATLMARLVALHVAHSGDGSKAAAEAPRQGVLGSGEAR